MRGFDSGLRLAALTALLLAASTPSMAQVSDEARQQGPRFLLAEVGKHGQPIPVDVSRTPLLRKRLSLDLTNVPIKQALAAVTEQAGLDLVYSDDVLPASARVTLRAEGIAVAAALTDILLDADVDVVFTRDGRASLAKREHREPVRAVVQASVAGTVVDPLSLPVPLAAVTIPGTTTGTRTDASGRFRLNNLEGTEVALEVRLIGYKPLTQRVRVGDLSIRLTLSPLAVNLEQMVVTGTAGGRSRAQQPAVVAVIDAAKVVEASPVSTLSQVLQSRVPGVDVMQGTGSPGVASRIRIRGEASINLSNEPLIFIDGVRVDSRQVRIAPPGTPNSSCCDVGGQVATRLDDIAPEDIQSIEIVKGPAAATLYGADASAGVIQVITKRGTAGAFRQTVTAEYNLITPTYDPPDNWAVCTLAAISSGAPICQGRSAGALVTDNPMRRENVWGQGKLQSLAWSGRGGSELFNYHLSGSGQKESGYLPNSEYDRYSGRLNVTWTPMSKLRIDGNYGVTRINNQLLDDNSSGAGMLTNSLLGNPLTVGLRANGWLGTKNSTGIKAIENTIKTTKNTPSLTLHLSLADWFNNRLIVGADLVNSNSRRLMPRNDQNWYPGFDQGVVREMLTDYQQLTIDYLGNVRRAFHLLGREWSSDLALGTQVIATTNNQLWGVGTGLASNTATTVSAAAQKEGGQFTSEERSVGWMSQWELGYEHRLFLQLGLRVDKNSSFGERVGAIYLPKAGASWVLSEEPFFRNLFPFANTLRLRTAYGVTGRAPQPGAPATTYLPSPYISDNNSVSVGILLNNPGNPNLRPERGREFELGLDAGVLNQRLGTELTYFRKVTTDLLLSRSLPFSYGYQQDPWDNVGEVVNSGLEAVVSAQPVTRPDFAWDLRLQVSTLHNEVVDLGAFPQTFGLQKGRPIMGFYSRRIRRVDAARNVAVLSDSMDFLGNRLPRYEGSLSTGIAIVRSLHINAQFDFKQKFLTANNTQEYRERHVVVAREAVDPNYLSQTERLRRYGPYVSESGTALGAFATYEPWISDGSFVRLRELSFTFDLPRRFASMFADRGSITLAGRNLALWTKYKGPDPESISSGTWYEPFGQSDWFNPPQGRRWVIRTNLSF